jgi:hypothetical protein
MMPVDSATDSSMEDTRNSSQSLLDTTEIVVKFHFQLDSAVTHASRSVWKHNTLISLLYRKFTSHLNPHTDKLPIPKDAHLMSSPLHHRCTATGGSYKAKFIFKTVDEANSFCSRYRSLSNNDTKVSIEKCRTDTISAELREVPPCMNIQDVQQHLHKYGIPATLSYISYHDGAHSLDRYKLTIPRDKVALLATIPMIRTDTSSSTTLKGQEALAFFGRQPVLVYQTSRLWVCTHCGAVDKHSKADCPYKGVKHGDTLPNPFTNHTPHCMTCAATHIDCRQKLSPTAIKALKCFLCDKLGHTPRKCPTAFPPPQPIDEYINRSSKRQVKRERRMAKIYQSPATTSTSTPKRQRRADTPYLQAARRGSTQTANTPAVHTSEVDELKAQLQAALQLNQQLTKRVEQLEQRASLPSQSLPPPTQLVVQSTTEATQSTASSLPRGRKRQVRSTQPATQPAEEVTVVQQLATTVQQIKQWMNAMQTSMKEVKAAVASKPNNTLKVKLPRLLTKSPIPTSNIFAAIDAEAEVDTPSIVANTSSSSLSHDL